MPVRYRPAKLGARAAKKPCIQIHQDAKPAYQDAASHYSTIFERRFAGDYTSGYAALEDAMEDAAPASAIPSWPKFWMKLTIVWW